MAVVTKSRNTSEIPPESLFIHQEQTKAESINGAEKMGVFAGGQVWLNPLVMRQDIVIAHCHFEPGARTNWHKHEGGQLLRIVTGSGWVCDQGSKAKRVVAGDIVWCPPGGIHWHGADDGSVMVHEATSFGGLDWYDSVTEEEYAAKSS